MKLTTKNVKKAFAILHNEELRRRMREAYKLMHTELELRHALTPAGEVSKFAYQVGAKTMSEFFHHSDEDMATLFGVEYYGEGGADECHHDIAWENLIENFEAWKKQKNKTIAGLQNVLDQRRKLEEKNKAAQKMLEAEEKDRQEYERLKAKFES